MGLKGGASASAGNQSGTQQVQLDPETKAFRDSMFSQWGNLSGNIFKRFEDGGPDSFIPDQSANTQAYYTGAANLNAAGTNQPTVNTVYDQLARGAWGQVDPLTGGGNIAADTYTGTGYTAESVDDGTGGYQAQTYLPAGYFDVNAVPSYTASGYSAAQTQGLDPTRISTAAENFAPYESLVDERLINPALAGFDRQSARGLTALRAGRDAGSAFGDRARNADAIYQADSDLNREQLAAQLRATGLDKAFQYAGGDADRKAQGALQDRSLEASRRDANANRSQQADADNAAARTEADRYLADARMAATRYNYDTTNQAQLRNADAQTAALAASAAARQANALQNAQARNAASAYGADARNAATAAGSAARNAAAQFNAQQELARQQANAAIAQQNIATRLSGAEGLQGLDQQTFQNTLAALAARGQAGAEQDAFNQMKAREPLDLLGMAGSILSGVPYGSTTTSQQKSRSKSGSVGL